MRAGKSRDQADHRGHGPARWAGWAGRRIRHETRTKEAAISAKSIADKLLIKPGSTLWLSDPARRPLVEPLPAGVRDVDRPDGATTAVVFADDAASLRALLDVHAAALARTTVFWVAYPKANRTDINRDTLWPIVGGYGMRPIGQVAVDDTWSALRFRPVQPGEAPFSGGR